MNIRAAHGKAGGKHCGDWLDWKVWGRDATDGLSWIRWRHGVTGEAEAKRCSEEKGDSPQLCADDGKHGAGLRAVPEMAPRGYPVPFFRLVASHGPGRALGPDDGRLGRRAKAGANPRARGHRRAGAATGRRRLPARFAVRPKELAGLGLRVRAVLAAGLRTPTRRFAAPAAGSWSRCLRPISTTAWRNSWPATKASRATSFLAGAASARCTGRARMRGSSSWPCARPSRALQCGRARRRVGPASALPPPPAVQVCGWRVWQLGPA